MKKLLYVTIMLLAVIIFSGVVSAALPIDIDEVKIDGTTIESNTANRLEIQRDQDIDVKIRFTPEENLDDVEIFCFISGFEYSGYEPAEDSIPTSDYDVNVSYQKICKLHISDDFEEDDYKLRILFAGRNGEDLINTYNLKIDVPRNQLKIEDIVFYPSNKIEAGKALLTTVRIENNGEKDQDDVRITISIPELGIEGVDYIDEIEFDDEEETEEIFLRIPKCAPEGQYPVHILIEYGEYHRSISESLLITVEGNEDCETATESGTETEGKSKIVFGGDNLEISQGETALLGVTIKNEGKTSKTYIMSVEGADSFADVRITPQNTVIINGEDEKTLTLTVNVKDDAPVGSNIFNVKVNSEGDEAQQIITVNVKEKRYGLNNILEIALVALIVILIVIGLIFAFRKLKDDDEEEDLTGQTYY